MRYGLSAMLFLAIAASSIRAAGSLRLDFGPPSISKKTFESDAVVVGTVTFIERELIEAKRHPNATETMAHSIAVVKVDRVIKGWKSTTHLRVGFVEIDASNEHGFNLDDGNMCRILYLLQHETYLLFLNKHPDFAFYTFDSARTAPLVVPGPVQYCPDVAEAEIAANFQIRLREAWTERRDRSFKIDSNSGDPKMVAAVPSTEAQRLTALRSGKIDLHPADFDSTFDDNDEISIPLCSKLSTSIPSRVHLMRALFLASLLILVPSVASAKRAPGRTPVQSAAVAEFILLGHVTEFDKDPVEAESGPGTKDKIQYTMATVKVTEALRGLKTETHVKVGFMPSGRSPLNLVEKQDYLLFLTKHHSGNFYTMNSMSPPLAITKDTNPTVDEVKAVGKILADPAKALKAEKAEDKAFAAAALILHYRSPLESGVEQTLEAVPLAESQAILKAIGALDWTATPTVGGFEIIRTFYQLAIGADAGWKQPEPKPGDDTTAVLHKAYSDWLAGPGVKFQIQKFVAKKK